MTVRVSARSYRPPELPELKGSPEQQIKQIQEWIKKAQKWMQDVQSAQQEFNRRAGF